jgi:hypothetical protein
MPVKPGLFCPQSKPFQLQKLRYPALPIVRPEMGQLAIYGRSLPSEGVVFVEAVLSFVNQSYRYPRYKTPHDGHVSAGIERDPLWVAARESVPTSLVLHCRHDF